MRGISVSDLRTMHDRSTRYLHDYSSKWREH